ncbi:MAG: glycerate kinase [Thermosynechococcaceae cyanobacterium MS004]|nr:glycerate kinase [Thermosynechococcaceae cyanobacterium MS004]
MNIILAPDSFKGTLTAPQAAIALATGLRQSLPQATIVQLPFADGGEGTLDTLQSVLEGTRYFVSVQNAVGQLNPVPIYRCQPQGKPAAVLEAATVVGITDLAALQQPVQQRSTIGLGDLVRWALDQEIPQLFIGLGGSCTNDGGAGLLAALGVQFFNAAGEPLPPNPAGLSQLAAVDCTNLDCRIFDRELVILSDVDCPLCGTQGATHTFGRQKGLVDPQERDRVDQHLRHFATLTEQALLQQKPESSHSLGTHLRPGAGAAGGLGFALQLLGGTYQSGASLIAEWMDLPSRLSQADWLITGEGCSDRQTLAGKAPWISAQMAQAQEVPVTLLSGAIVPADLADLEQAFQGACLSLSPGASCCFSHSEAPSSPEDSKQNAANWLIKAGIQLGIQWSQGAFQKRP